MALGPFVNALENASGVTAQIVGKPTHSFFQTVINSLEGTDKALKVQRSDGDGDSGAIAIIGDDIESDLGGGANELGLWRVLGTHVVVYLFPVAHLAMQCEQASTEAA